MIAITGYSDKEDDFLIVSEQTAEEVAKLLGLVYYDLKDVVTCYDGRTEDRLELFTKSDVSEQDIRDRWKKWSNPRSYGIWVILVQDIEFDQRIDV
jgi:hypothetical protein